MPTLENVKLRIVSEGTEDFVGLWELISSVKRVIPPNESVMETALSIAGDLLFEGLIVPGEFEPNTTNFVLWQVPAQEALDRIRSDWQTLGREPSLGDVVWFVTTDAGKEYLRRASHQ